MPINLFRFNDRLSFTYIILLMFLIFITGCAEVRPLTVNTPNESRLRERVREFHVILGNNNIAAWYAMTTPTVTKKMTFEQFKQDFRWDEKSTARATERMEAELSRVCSCVEMGYIRCVIIADVLTTKPDGKTVKDKPLEMWEFADGEWYWGYIGSSLRGKCPGER